MCLCVFKEYSRSMAGYYSSQCQDRYFHVSSWSEKDQRHLNNSGYCLCLSLKQLENVLGLLEEQNTLEDILVWIIIIKNLCVCLYPCLCLSLCLFLPFSSLVRILSQVCGWYLPQYILHKVSNDKPKLDSTKVHLRESMKGRIAYNWLWGVAGHSCEGTRNPLQTPHCLKEYQQSTSPIVIFFFKWA